jgi:Tfp pilus assembly protein PilO
VIRRIWLIAAALVVVMVLIWFTAFWNRVGRDLAEEREQRNEAEAAVAQAESERDRLAAAARNIPPLQSQLSDLEAAIPPEPALAELVLQVSEAGRLSGLDVARVISGDPVAENASGDGLTEIPVELQVRGGYFQVLDFINRLSSQRRIYVIDEVDLSALGDEAQLGPPELGGTLHGRVFTTKTAGEIVIVEPPLEPTTTTTASTTSTTSTTMFGSAAATGASR